MAAGRVQTWGFALAALFAACSGPGAAGKGDDAKPKDPALPQVDAAGMTSEPAPTQGDDAKTVADPGDPEAKLPACGDREVMARFHECKEAASKYDQAACEAAGGHWGRIGLHGGCNCPTGQIGCACKQAGDCLGKCILVGGGRSCPEDPAKCTWLCSSHHDVVGCHCHMMSSGGTMAVCAD